MRRGDASDCQLLKDICESLGIPCPDPERVLAEPRNIVLFEDNNCAMFLWRWTGIYEGHVLYTIKGRAADELARRMLEVMRGAMILAVTPQRHVGLFLRRLGFEFRGEVETIGGEMSQMYQLEPRR